MFLWTDARCIYQCCRWKREMQVAIMAQILSNAAAVLVWLGVHNEDSRKVMRNLGLHYESPSQSPSQDLQPDFPSILNRSYRSRMRIVQEMYLAKELIAGCGDFFVKWDNLIELLESPSQVGDIIDTKALPIISQRMSRGAEGGRILK
jgi:Heterokaryon incompatibility protein (HET)